MKLHVNTKIATIIISTMLSIGYTTAQNKPSNLKDRNQEHPRKKPTTEEVFKQMDSNKDNKLSKDEVKGPIKNDFATIDTNNDGYITNKELDIAPKPQNTRPQNNK